MALRAVEAKVLSELTVLAPNTLAELCTFNDLTAKPTDAPSALIAGAQHAAWPALLQT